MRFSAFSLPLIPKFPVAPLPNPTYCTLVNRCCTVVHLITTVGGCGQLYSPYNNSNNCTRLPSITAIPH